MKKILIIDDSLIARKGIKKSLPKDISYEIYDANDGVKGLEVFKVVSPDITFLDLTMPEMDGFQALEEMERIDKNAIVIVVTADIQPKTFERVMGLGAYRLLKKPPIRKEIQEAVIKAIEFKEKLENK